MKPAKVEKSQTQWSAAPEKKPKRARKTSRTSPVGDLTAMIADYHQMEETLALAIDRQEAAASSYFHGESSSPAPQPETPIEPGIEERRPDTSAALPATPPTVAPIKIEHALRIEDINDAEFSIVALTGRMEEMEEKILSATPKSREDGLAKMRFMLSILIADSDQQDKFPDRMIDKCLAALS